MNRAAEPQSWPEPDNACEVAEPVILLVPTGTLEALKWARELAWTNPGVRLTDDAVMRIEGAVASAAALLGLGQ